MTFNKEDAETLAALGLTGKQTKVYLTLASLGNANAKNIWKSSGVARQDIYRILTELQEKSLVEKIIATPTKYRALPIQDGLTILLKHKADEYDEAMKNVKELLTRFRSNHEEKEDTKEYEISMITTRDSNVWRINEGAINNKKSADIIDSWESFKHAIAVYNKQLIMGAKKGVKFRYITDKPKDGETIPKFFQTLKKNGWVELRHIPTRPPASIRIEDGKQVTICVTTARYTLEAPSLFSDNPCLVAVLQDYFELLWSKATENKSN